VQRRRMRPDGSAGLMRDDPDGAQLIRSRRFGGAGCDALQHRSAERAKGRSRLRSSLQHELAEQSAMRGAAARAEGAAVEVQHRGGGTAWGGRKFVGGGAGVAHTLLGDEPAAPHINTRRRSRPTEVRAERTQREFAWERSRGRKSLRRDDNAISV
jgi:hypothetical protein